MILKLPQDAAAETKTGRQELQAVLANPAAAADILKDPVRLQRLLEENPALMSVLKSRLGS